MEPGEPICRYAIDPEDRLVEVDEGFGRFAEANGAPGLVAQSLGEPLLDGIAGRQTRQLWRHLIDRARGGGPIVALPFRCDGPTLRRYLRMDVAPERGGLLRFTTYLESEEPRGEVRLAEHRRGTGDMVRMCSWCLRVDASGWVEIEVATRRLGLLAQDEPPPISHGVCADCSGRLMA